jgi:hypothetical protein
MKFLNLSLLQSKLFLRLLIILFMLTVLKLGIGMRLSDSQALLAQMKMLK